MSKVGTVACVILISAIMFMVSCAPSPTTTQATTPPVTAPPTSSVAPVVTTAPAGTPKYGGTFNAALGDDIRDFEEVYGWLAPAITIKMTNEELCGGDWAKGPAGTNQVDWTETMHDRWDSKTGYLAESWDFSKLNEGILVFKIRKGVHWALNPNSEASRLVNGRELTADDVVFNFKQYTTHPRAYIYRSYPLLRNIEITATDKYTVVIKVPLPATMDALTRFGDFASIYPPEVVNKYGDMTNWRVSVGTGPFMLTDFVSASSATLLRNPNYWMKDPVGPGKGNQLPYLDSVRLVIITDASTRLAAFRTAKVDHAFGQSWEDAAELQARAPELLSKKFWSGHCRPIHMRLDKPELPYKDVRVRRALMMATDYQSIAKDLYGGEALLVSWPISYIMGYEKAYLGLDDPECPASVKELYTYNPDKAKALLKEAGYPNGFKAKLMVLNDATIVDYYSAVKNMWSKIGVDLTLEPKEYGVWWSAAQARQYDEMMFGTHSGVGTLYVGGNLYGPMSGNGSYVDDPVIIEARSKMIALASLGNQAEADKVHKELMKHVLDQAYALPRPDSKIVTLWWPWLKNFRGENAVGYHNAWSWTRYVWIDQDLKEKMTGRR